jgi:hypothetical protein
MMQSALGDRRLRSAVVSLFTIVAGCLLAAAMASSAGAADTRGTLPSNPGYTIDKEVAVNGGSPSDGPVTAEVGDTLDYTVTVSNGDDFGRVISVSDDNCTLASQTSGFDGSDDSYGTNTSATFTCSRTVVEGDEPSIENTACATETPQARGLQQCDSVTVNVLHVSVEKRTFDATNCEKGRGDSSCWTELYESAEPGEYIFFEIAVTNDGGAPIFYTITDNGCSFFLNRSLPGGNLDPGQTAYWYCEHYVTYDDPDPYVNEACVSAFEQIIVRNTRGSDTTDCDTSAADLVFNTITGQITEDMDADGSEETGDGGLAGRTVRLQGSVADRGFAVDETTTTDSNGNYVFDRVQPGNYTVTSEVPEGWTCSYPSGCSHEVVMPFEQEQQPPARVTNVGGNDFGHWTVGQISGRAFTDTNGNGAEDGGEGPLSGFTHYVDLNDNGAQDGGEPAANSAGDGTFAIAGLNPGNYRVRQVAGVGYTCTAPSSCQADVTVLSSSTASVLFGDRPPGTAPPPPPPDDLGGALPDTAAARRVRLVTPSGCRRRPFTAYVRGGTVTDRVVFSIDGRRVRTVTRSQGGRFNLRIDPRRFRAGAHRVTARLTFEDSRIRSRTLRGTFLRCAAAAAPRFTG